MAKPKQISLTGQLNCKVASGLYNDAAEVVRESLRFMQLHEEWIYQLKHGFFRLCVMWLYQTA